MRTYHLYGLCLRSQWPLPCPERTGPGLVEVELHEGSDSLFAAASKELTRGPNATQWFHRAQLRDGSDYLRWSGIFESVVSRDGRRIAGRLLNGALQDVLQSYILSHVISFALLKLGMEPLHSTAVAIDGGAVGFMGDSGFGKSTLGAAFLQHGHPVLTDDLLIVRKESGGVYAYPGHPRVKLFPEIARALFGQRVNAMFRDPYSLKVAIPVDPELITPGAIPLRAVYVIRPTAAGSHSERVTIRSLNPRRAFLDLITNTVNTVVTEPDRLARQFDQAGWLCTSIPVKSLSYPRHLSRLAAVVEAVRSDLAVQQRMRGACA